MKSPKANQLRLQEISSHLRGLLSLQPWESPIPHELATFAADAIDLFLSGKAPSLDAAFGVIRARGRPPRQDKERDRMTLVASRLRDAGKSWLEVMDELGEQFPNREEDERTVRRWYVERLDQLLAKELSDELCQRLGRTGSK